MVPVHIRRDWTALVVQEADGEGGRRCGIDAAHEHSVLVPAARLGGRELHASAQTVFQNVLPGDLDAGVFGLRAIGRRIDGPQERLARHSAGRAAVVLDRTEVYAGLDT